MVRQIISNQKLYMRCEPSIDYATSYREPVCKRPVEHHQNQWGAYIDWFGDQDVDDRQRQSDQRWNKVIEVTKNDEIKKFYTITPEECEARKWESRFCAIKVMYAPESDCEVPETAQEFIDSVTQMLPPSKLKEIDDLLLDALRTTKHGIWKDLQSIKDIKLQMKRRFGREIWSPKSSL